MSAEGISVRARISLLATSEGGKTVPIRGSYRPNHNFGGADDREMTTGFIELADGAELKPGEASEFVLLFWSHPGLKAQLYPGREWRIQEGARLVGYGRVLEVLS